MFARLAVLASLSILVPGAMASQPATKPTEVARMPWGHPDLQGYWTTQTFKPLERPEHRAGQEFFTEEESAALERQLAAEGVDPSAARELLHIEDPEEIERCKYQADRAREERHHIHYDNAIWLRTPVPKGRSSRRTSLITDPPDGRFPALAPAAAAGRAAEAEVSRQLSAFDSHETRPLSERSVVWAHEGPPILPPSYNDIHQIFQTPDHLVVFSELAANPPRIIPLDGRPHVPDAIRQLAGDSRGRWEGETLVIETRSYSERRRYRGSSGSLHVVERFTRIAPDRIHYEFTVTDPITWTSPWSTEVPMVKTDGPLFEHACHESNHDIRHILEFYRNLEAQSAGATDRVAVTDTGAR